MRRVKGKRCMYLKKRNLCSKTFCCVWSRAYINQLSRGSKFTKLVTLLWCIAFLHNNLFCGIVINIHILLCEYDICEWVFRLTSSDERQRAEIDNLSVNVQIDIMDLKHFDIAYSPKFKANKNYIEQQAQFQIFWDDWTISLVRRAAIIPKHLFHIHIDISLPLKNELVWVGSVDGELEHRAPALETKTYGNVDVVARPARRAAAAAVAWSPAGAALTSAVGGHEIYVRASAGVPYFIYYL